MRVNVSVAMATFNGEKYLREQLDSLYSQTICPSEVVVCDDGSVDGTIDILKEYRDKYGLIFFVNNKNIGVNKNFEKAIRLTSGEYVSICDQDDVWFPNKIEKMLNKMLEIENGKPCVVSSQAVGFSGSVKNLILQRNKKDSVGIGATLLQTGNVQGCTLMLNRKMIELLRPFPESYKETMMYDCYISFVAAVCGIKYNIGEPLMFYRHHDSNVLGKNTGKKTVREKILGHMANLKYNRLFPGSRSYSLEYIYNEYQDEITKESLFLVQNMIAYGKARLIGRIQIILQISQYTFIQKFKFILAEFFALMVPQKVIKKNN